jgi:CTP synthase
LPVYCIYVYMCAHAKVIHQERRGDYLGKTVQIVPHVTDVVQSWIQEVARVTVDGSGIEPDVCLIEVCSPNHHSFI